jgi:hypothetical protein
MADARVCDACGMEFDWPGVEAKGYEYCCEPCSRGENCVCSQHDHQYAVVEPGETGRDEATGAE